MPSPPIVPRSRIHPSFMRQSNLMPIIHPSGLTLISYESSSKPVGTQMSPTRISPLIASYVTYPRYFKSYAFIKEHKVHMPPMYELLNTYALPKIHLVQIQNSYKLYFGPRYKYDFYNTLDLEFLRNFQGLFPSFP